jgi:hypothetical protein
VNTLHFPQRCLFNHGSDEASQPETSAAHTTAFGPGVVQFVKPPTFQPGWQYTWYICVGLSLIEAYSVEITFLSVTNNSSEGSSPAK